MNGGFFEPPEGEPVRVIATRHATCGERTRVRLPAAVPARVVRRVECEACAEAYEAQQVEEIGVEEASAAGPRAARPRIALPSPSLPRPRVSLPSLSLPRPRISLPSPSLPRPSLPKLDPGSRFWRLASIPLAAAAVIGALLHLQGGEDSPVPIAPAVEPPAPAPVAEQPPGEAAPGAGAGNAASRRSEIVSSSEFSLALPGGWRRVEPPAGATFAAVAPGGAADATLWIEEDPKLDFPTFVSQSITQLEALAGAEPEIVERVPGPTPETSVVRLAADAPPGQPSYEVTLRAAGPYRYYLATTIEPDAPSEAVEGAELIAGSFAPQPQAGR